MAHWRTPKTYVRTADGDRVTILLSIFVGTGLTVGSITCVYYIALIFIGAR
jgi:hypothetical protein